MIKNIFNPKGSINQLGFIINYIVLTLMYIVGGVILQILIHKYNLSILYFIFPVLLIKILILFNYKKRLLDVTQKVIISSILAFVLTFDTELLSFCQLIKDAQVSMIIFFIGVLFALFVQPALVAVLPSKSKKK